MSKSRQERDRMVKEISNDMLKEKFIQDLGSKARVDRTEIENERLAELREVIGAVGTDLQKVGAVPEGMTYCGSLSVHIFKSIVMNTAAFATVNNLQNLTPDLADGALRELTGTTMMVYGKARQKLRSGF